MRQEATVYYLANAFADIKKNANNGERSVTENGHVTVARYLNKPP